MLSLDALAAVSVMLWIMFDAWASTIYYFPRAMVYHHIKRDM